MYEPGTVKPKKEKKKSRSYSSKGSGGVFQVKRTACTKVLKTFNSLKGPKKKASLTGI